MEIMKINATTQPILKSSQRISQNNSVVPKATLQKNSNDNNKKIALAGAVALLLALFLLRTKIKNWFKCKKPTDTGNISKPKTPEPPKAPEKPKVPEITKTPEAPKVPEVKPETENLPKIDPQENRLEKEDFIPDEQFIADLKTKIDNSKNYFELKSAEAEANKIQQGEIRTEIFSQINEIREKMIHKKKQEHFLSSYEVSQMMEKCYNKSYNAPESDVNLIKSRLGEEASEVYKRTVETPIKNYSTIVLMRKIANKCNGKYLDFWKKNPDMLKFYAMSQDYSLINQQTHVFDQQIWDILISNFIKSVDGTMDEDMLKSVIKYGKNSYYDHINGLLRIKNALDKPITQENLDYVKKLVNDKSLFSIIHEEMHGSHKKVLEMLDIIEKKLSSSENIDNDMQELKNYIDELDNKLGLTKMINNIKKCSSTLEHDINVTRLERFEFLKGIECDGMNIYDIMIDAYGNPESAAKVEKYFSDGGKIEVVRPAFISTSIPPYSLSPFYSKFNIQLKQGTEYVYISDLQHCFYSPGKTSTEAEILVMPGHKMTITNAEYVSNLFGRHKWYLDCVVEKV